MKLLNLKENSIVLDVAAGTGEPGLSIAPKVPKGKVVITDLADDMLEIARENANNRNIKNIDLASCYVCEMPFENNYFDAISCRFGFMFFPDMLLAASEMIRVLKSGGKMATSVWNISEKNFWVTAMASTIRKHMNIPPPLSGAPGMFRCCEDGLFESILNKAGFKNIFFKVIDTKLSFESAEEYWTMMTEISAPFVSALAQADINLKDNIMKDVCSLINNKFPNGPILMDASAIIFHGEKE